MPIYTLDRNAGPGGVGTVIGALMALRLYLDNVSAANSERGRCLLYLRVRQGPVSSEAVLALAGAVQCDCMRPGLRFSVAW
jgi:hypothetical protein